MPERVSRNFGLGGPECEQHTPAPDGYFQWEEWAEAMEETHVQRQCTGCGLWVIWEPKGSADAR